MGPGGRSAARLVHVKSMHQVAVLFATVLFGQMFEAQANGGGV